MTAIELRTSIVADLDQMSTDMLESVSQYVKRLRRHARPGLRATHTRRTHQSAAVATDEQLASEITPRVLRFKRGNPWHATDEEVEQMRYEYLTEKYKMSWKKFVAMLREGRA